MNIGSVVLLIAVLLVGIGKKAEFHAARWLRAWAAAGRALAQAPALRHVAFNLVSIATDCGFVSQDYAAWPMFAPMIILMLSCYCANTGSTGGGIKMFRTLVLFRQAVRELFLLVHPQAATPVCRARSPRRQRSPAGLRARRQPQPMPGGFGGQPVKAGRLHPDGVPQRPRG